MSVFHKEHRSIIKRINSLESQNRVMRLLLIAVIVIFVGCSRIDSVNYTNPATAISEQGVLELKQLVFKDDNSNIRVKIDVTNDSNIQQSFYDRQGNERAQISIDEEGSARFRLFDTAGSTRFSAVTFSDTNAEAANYANMAVLGFGNQNNTSENGGIFISTAPDGASRNVMFSKDGVAQLGTYVLPDGTTTNQMFNKDGKLQVAQSILPDGGAMNEIYSNKNLPSYKQFVLSDGSTGYQMYDSSGTLRHSFNTLNNDFKVANQLMYDDGGNLRQTNFTSLSSSGKVNLDRNGVKKTSTVISEDNSLAHYVEKSASEKAIDLIDGALRVGDIIRVFSGNK